MVFTIGRVEVKEDDFSEVMIQFIAFCRSGNIAAAQLLARYEPELLSYEKVSGTAFKCLRSAIRSESLELVQWLIVTYRVTFADLCQNPISEGPMCFIRRRAIDLIQTDEMIPIFQWVAMHYGIDASYFRNSHVLWDLAETEPNFARWAVDEFGLQSEEDRKWIMAAIIDRYVIDGERGRLLDLVRFHELSARELIEGKMLIFAALYCREEAQALASLYRLPRPVLETPPERSRELPLTPEGIISDRIRTAMARADQITAVFDSLAFPVQITAEMVFNVSAAA